MKFAVDIFLVLFIFSFMRRISSSILIFARRDGKRLRARAASGIRCSQGESNRKSLRHARNGEHLHSRSLLDAVHREFFEPSRNTEQSRRLPRRNRSNNESLTVNNRFLGDTRDRWTGKGRARGERAGNA